MTLTLHVSGEMESLLTEASRLRGMDPTEYALALLERDLVEQKRRQSAVDLLQSWIDRGNAEEQRATYDYLTSVLDEDRPSERKLFPPELRGITW